MIKNRLNLVYPLVVEGKYDKIKLANIVSSPIVVLNGFTAFNDKEKLEQLRKIGKNGLILLTDSDKAGNFIRGKLKGLINGEIINLYIPAVKGKEKRKNVQSKEGLLGVEGMEDKLLFGLLKDYQTQIKLCNYLDGSRFMQEGFYGGGEAAVNRKKLAESLNLPNNLSVKAMIELINLTIKKEEYIAAVKNIQADSN